LTVNTDISLKLKKAKSQFSFGKMNNLKFKWTDSGIWVKRFHREDRKADRGEPNLQLDEDLIAKMETWFGDFSEQVKLQTGQTSADAPELSALAAIAVCKKFKNSEEVSRLLDIGFKLRRKVDWRACDGCEDVLCGFCRFVRWIKIQKLPRVLQAHCKTVLSYLATKHPEFDDASWMTEAESTASDSDSEEDVDEDLFW